MITDAPLAADAEALRTGRTDLVAYLERLRDRTKAAEPQVHAFLDEPDRWKRLDREAGDLRERHPDAASRPALFGIPVGVKDIFHTDGFETRAGSSLPPEELAGAEATAVTRLREAGALVMGKTYTTEFAYASPGPTRNPHDTDHTPGGSSSGSAAAVAAGLCPLALGSQTIGSVIRPAAFCGIVGVKPSYGRIPTRGVIPYSESVDTVGFFTQDVPGARLAAAALCDGWRALPEPTEPPMIGVPEGPYVEQASDEGIAGFDDAISDLESAGYQVERVDAFADIEAVNDRHEDMIAADMALAHHEWFEAHGDRYADVTAEHIQEGRAVDVGHLAEGRAGRNELRASLSDAMHRHGIDVWVSPPAPGPAPEGIDSTGDPTMNLPWTHAGVPAVTIPTGKGPDGLPLGLQCTARYMDDERLLAWAGGLAAAVGE